MAKNKEAAIRFLESILLPAARIVMRFGVSAPEAAEVTRWSFVRAFNETRDFWRYETATDTQCAIMTGLARNDISRLADIATCSNVELPARKNRVSRVIEGWLNDPEYQENGQPKPMRFGVFFPNFKQLCRQYAGPSDPRNILDNLIRSGCVEENEGVYTLVDVTYGLKLSDFQRLEIITDMINRLLETSDHNIRHERSEDRLLQRYWRQRHVPKAKLAEARAIINEEAIAAGRRVDRRLVELSGGRTAPLDDCVDVGFAVYQFQDESRNNVSTDDELTKGKGDNQ